MRPSFPADYLRQHAALAEESLKALVILRHDDWERGGIVVVGNPNGSSCYRCEIVLVPSGHLILTGDLSTMVWGRYREEGGVRDAIQWMAKSHLDYVHEKACIGMGNIGCDEFDLGVARREAADRLNDEICTIGMPPSLRAGECPGGVSWGRIVTRLHGNEPWDHPSVSKMVYEILNDSDIPALGIVPSARLLWAWSMVRRAHELFKERGYNASS